jgi:hypothetical protein
MPVVMGEGLKPLNVNQIPRESSHRATGRVAIADHGEIGSMMPNSTAMVEVMSRGAPMSPIRGRARGTRPDRYIRVPSRSALVHG